MTETAAGFPPIAAPGARILILGSMPGRASLAAEQYYAHPRNAFWPILGTLLGFDPTLPYPERTIRLEAAGIALWDVVRSCRRRGSLDSAIEADSIIANDFAGFLERHPGISRICFNGATAEALFHRYAPAVASQAQVLRLPSTSPAHAGLNFSGKLTAWRAALASRE